MSESILKVSLKDYKKDIEDLKGTLLGLERGTEAYNKTLKDLRDKQEKLNSVMQDTKRGADAAEGSYNALVQQMASLRKEWKETDDIARRNELGKQIADVNTQLKDLDSSIGNYQRNVGNYEGATVSLKAQLKEMTVELQNMAANGLKGSEAYIELKNRAGELKDILGDVKSDISNASNDIRGIANAVTVFGDGVAIWGTYQSAVALFGGETKRTDEAMKKILSTMALLNNVQKVSKALFDNSSVTYKVMHKVLQALNIEKKTNLAVTKQQAVAEQLSTAGVTENTIAVGANTVAMGADTVATGAATVATKLFRKALMATGIGLFVVAIGTAVAYLEDFVEVITKGIKWITDLLGITHELTDAEKAEAEAKQQQIEMNKSFNAMKTTYYQEVGKSVGEIIGKMKVLQTEWKALKTTAEKEEWLKRNRQRFDELGLSVKNVDQAEKVLVTQTPKIVEALKARAKAIAAQNALVANEAEMYEKLAELNAKPVVYAKLRGNATYGDLTDDEKRMFSYDSDKSVLQKQDIDIANRLRQQTALDRRSKEEKNITDTYTKRTGYLVKEVQTTSKDAADKLKEAGDLIVDGLSGGGGKSGGSGSKNDKPSAFAKYQADLTELTKVTSAMTDALEKSYNLSEKTTADEIALTESKHINMVAYYDDYKAKLKEALKDAKIEKDEKIKIQEKLDEVDTASKKEQDAYDVKMHNLRKKRREEELKEIKDNIKQQIEENKSLQSQSEFDTNTKYKKKELELKEDDDLGKIDLEIAKEKELYDLKISALTNEIKLKKELQSQYDVDSVEYAKIADEIANLNQQMANATTTHELYTSETTGKKAKAKLKEEKKNIEQRKEFYRNFAYAVGDVMGMVSDYMQQQTDKELQQGKISEEEAKRRFEQQKALQIGMTLINTFAGAAGSYEKTKQTTGMWGEAAAWIDFGMTLANGLAQVAAIEATRFNGGSGSASGGASGGYRTSVNPLLMEQLDSQNLQNVNLQGVRDNTSNQNTRVWISQKDLTNSDKQVKTRIAQSVF